jgi:pimeloyl-ACP methyl ester carboxylesterase
MEKLSFKLNDEDFTVWHLKGPQNGPVLHWSHANGFNALTYENLLKKLSTVCHVYSWDARSHGLTQNVKPAKSGYIYSQYCSDFIELINQLHEKHGTRVILSGHSFGATICIKSELALKNKISKLILADPVLFTPFYKVMSQILRFIKVKSPRALYLAHNARHRQNQWRNRAEVLSIFSQKKLFQNWDQKSLFNYIEYGTKSFEYGIKLSCPPEIESLIFKESENEFLSQKIRSFETDTYVFFASKGSPAFAKNAFNYTRRTIGQSTVLKSNHLFPIEKYKAFSERMIDIILEKN